VTTENSASPLPNDCCCQPSWLASPVPHLRRPSTGKRAAPANRSIEKSEIVQTVEQFIADLDDWSRRCVTRVGQNKAAIMNKEIRVVAGLAQPAVRSSHAA
jgi:hypothetical protein